MEWGYLGLWIILAGIFLAGEIFTAGFFLFWFGVAAGVTAIVALFVVYALAVLAPKRRLWDRPGAPKPG